MEKIKEVNAWKVSGYIMIGILLIIGYLFFTGGILDRHANPILTIFSIAIFLGIVGGLIVVQPNEAKVLVFFGNYIGTVSASGLWWVNPLTLRKSVSLRIHNLNSETLKVNDLKGNPIEIAAVVVWRVVDSAKALFDVENYQEFVKIQCETAIRALASQYSYDSTEEKKESLRGNQAEVSEELRKEVQARLEIAGIEVLESRISHLAYAPEIAQVMLRRQQADAIIAARARIVEGAVGMVEHAIQLLSQKKLIDLDSDKKAQMTNNLLVALVSEHEVTPVMNTGTLYS
ncbi:MAG: SPFH domain-containing protein [Candidatus Omnitrophica bacterium]|nr:SPFH domain-containing protein [Candidatus Omnitrophota bacterium]